MLTCFGIKEKRNSKGVAMLCSCSHFPAYIWNSQFIWLTVHVSFIIHLARSLWFIYSSSMFDMHAFTAVSTMRLYAIYIVSDEGPPASSQLCIIWFTIPTTITRGLPLFSRFEVSQKPNTLKHPRKFSTRRTRLRFHRRRKTATITTGTTGTLGRWTCEMSLRDEREVFLFVTNYVDELARWINYARWSSSRCTS